MARVRPAERRWLLKRLNGEAQKDLDDLWFVAENSESFRQTMLEGYPGIVDPYHQLAADMAAEWFDEADPESDYTAEPVEPLDEERLTNSVEWALNVGTAVTGLALLSGSLQRSVFDGARATTILNTRNTRGKWSVMSAPDCCEFCTMLGTRGFVYASQESAEAAIGGWHDNCNCIAVEDR